MALKTVTKFVVPFSELPIDLTFGHWILKYPEHSFVETHIEEEGIKDALGEWIMKKYPELIDEESFFIHIDV